MANQNPNNALNYKIELITTDNTNGNIFEEPHSVSSPSPYQSSFNIPLNASSISPGKIVIPLTNDTSDGSYWIKLWLPQPNSSTMYITFSQRVFGFGDGYYDFVTGIPTAYRTALRGWILDNRTLPLQQSTKSKELEFNFVGLDTNQASASELFTVRFSSVFQPAGGGSTDPTGPVGTVSTI